MTEEALDPAADDAAGGSERAPTAPRRRRRGGRGRGRGAGRSPARRESQGAGRSARQGPSGADGAAREAEPAGEEASPEGPPAGGPAEGRRTRRRAPASPARKAGSVPDERAADGDEAAPPSEVTEGWASRARGGGGSPKAASTRSRRSRSRGGRARRPVQPVEPTEEEGSPVEAPEEPTEAAGEPPPEQAAAQPTDGEEPRPAARRSRRRSRSRPKKEKEAAEPAPAVPEPAPPPADEAAPADEVAEAREEAVRETPSQKRRRRRRRRKPGEEAAAGQALEPVDVVAVAPVVAAEAAPPARATATRTVRARDRRRAPGRRRPLEVVGGRRTDKHMLITEQAERIRIAVLEGRELVEHYVTRTGARSMVGNIYLGRVQNVLPGMEAAFVDVGRGRNAVLYAGEVSYDEDVEASERRIERALKPGQSVLVQVTKDPMGGKGARLTAQISLPGRYLVYVPEGGLYGISRRLPDNERRRLRDIMKEIRPSGAGVIVRTAAEGASAEDLAADLERLKKTWDSIKRKSRRAKAPAALYEEPELTIRVIRDVVSPAEFREIVTDSPEIFEQVRDYLGGVSPDLLDHVRLHTGPLPVFEEFHVLEQIHKALERKVWLPSGGYLVIDRTEAMTVIDVNTGKHVGKTNLEETVVGTNIEAAREIARQLRLRDIGGIIVIDFIDMLLEKNRDLVIRTLKEAMAKDKTRSQVFDITPLGLLEVTRKKVSAGLVEAFSETCPTCEGRGILLTHEV